jgi:hypothetical protein
LHNVVWICLFLFLSLICRLAAMSFIFWFRNIKSN